MTKDGLFACMVNLQSESADWSLLDRKRLTGKAVQHG